MVRRVRSWQKKIRSHCPLAGAHPACAGPWLKPSLDFCNCSTAEGTAIIREALVAFRNMLHRLTATPGNLFQLVDTQGTLSATDWANKLHPFPAGFAKVAQLFSDALSWLTCSRLTWSRPPRLQQARLRLRR
jgi:hypothetical protein